MSPCTCGLSTKDCPIHDAPEPIKPKRTIPDDNYDLTSRETELRNLIIKGLSNSEIADIMQVRPKTIRQLMIGIYAKYRCSTRTEVIATHFGLR